MTTYLRLCDHTLFTQRELTMSVAIAIYPASRAAMPMVVPARSRGKAKIQSDEQVCDMIRDLASRSIHPSFDTCKSVGLRCNRRRFRRIRAAMVEGGLVLPRSTRGFYPGNKLHSLATPYKKRKSTKASAEDIIDHVQGPVRAGSQGNEDTIRMRALALRHEYIEFLARKPGANRNRTPHNRPLSKVEVLA